MNSVAPGPTRIRIADDAFEKYPEVIPAGEKKYVLSASTKNVEAFILTGITNAASEGTNRLIKLEARNAFGFRNPINQRLRSRCATTRAARRQAKPG